MGQMLPLLGLILTANGDTLLLAAGWSMRRRELPPRSALLLAGSTSLLTAFSLWGGRQTAVFIPEGLTKSIAALLLTGLGLWVLIRAFWERENEPASQPATASETLLLGFALAVNNMGMGAAAGLAGMPPVLAGGMNFAACLGCLRLGRLAGRGRMGRLPQRWMDALSGAVMMVLGAAAGLL